MDDAQLVEACKKKDRNAQKELYERYAAAMLGVCMRYTQSREAAEDVLHDGFLRIFDSIKSIRNPQSLRSWMHSIMIRTAVAYYRQNNDTTEIRTDETELELSDNTTQIYDNIDLEVILKAIKELPETYRITFNLCEVEEYEFDEVGEMLGVKSSTVRSNLCRAKKILQQKLSPLFDKQKEK